MIQIENAKTYGWEAAIRGMRNPLNSWDKSDSSFCPDITCCCDCIEDDDGRFVDAFIVGKVDLALMRKLAAAGTSDGKFLRMLTVTADITAPLYWWKEYDTYKVGTVANSCSTMHKIHAKPFTIGDFSHEHLLGEGCIPDHAYQNSYDVLSLIIDSLNFWRGIFVGEIAGEGIEKGDKRAWWQMIQLLPSSYNQKRTVQLNYAVLRKMHGERKVHKQDEWRDFCRWAETLPFAKELIVAEAKE